MPGLLRVFSFRSRAEIEELEREIAERPAARIGQRALAEEMTTLVHGAAETAKAVAASRALFGQGELAELDERRWPRPWRRYRPPGPAGRGGRPAGGPPVAELMAAPGSCRAGRRPGGRSPKAAPT